eukprot:s5414_g3.t1
MSTTRSLVSGCPDGDVTSDRPWAVSGSMANFSKSTLYDGLKTVRVEVDGLSEEVLVDDELGPVLEQPNGGRLFARLNYTQADRGSGFHTDRAEKTWPYLTSTERTAGGSGRVLIQDLGILLVGSEDFNFLGFYIDYNTAITRRLKV